MSVHRRHKRRWLCAVGAVALVVSGASANEVSDEDLEIALSLAEMLQAARTVISRNQDVINDPVASKEGLKPESVLAEAIEGFRETTGTDPLALPPESRQGRLLAAQREAILAVMVENQATINTPGMGFKGFVPATFARLVNEAFAERAGADAFMKVTAPPDLVRNLKSRPDAFENDVIAEHFSRPDWPEGEPFRADAEADGRPAHRVLVPEYYAQSCLTCHGEPKGELDVTGYPKEGGHMGQLGGVISVTLYR